MLMEITLLAEAGSRLPDERVPAQEYATTLCALIQRHSGAPSPEFWVQLICDRPLRQREIDRLKGAFEGVIREPPGAPPPRGGPTRRWRSRLAHPGLIAVILVALGAATTYCGSIPTAPKPPVECRDGTPSPTCDEADRGCCSHHGGIRPAVMRPKP